MSTVTFSDGKQFPYQAVEQVVKVLHAIEGESAIAFWDLVKICQKVFGSMGWQSRCNRESVGILSKHPILFDGRNEIHALVKTIILYVVYKKPEEEFYRIIDLPKAKV